MSAAPVTYSKDADGVGWIVFDAPESRANLLDSATQASLALALDRAAADAALKALVLKSAKERIFIAGADLKALVALPDPAAAAEFSRAGQRLFQRLADFPRPVVCAIHGACVGGGFELALACHGRVATNAAVTQLGLPETSIGTIPGWGGTVRLPRLIGAKPALDHILAGRPVSSDAAARAGLVTEVVAPSDLDSRAKAFALQLAKEGRPPPPPLSAAPPEVFSEFRSAVAAKTRGQLPALMAAIDAVEHGSRLEVPAALEVEAQLFGAVTAGPVCRNLIHVFFLREAAKKRTLEGWFEKIDAGRASPIQRVGVVGAGVMGSGIGHWLAAHGIEVVLRDVNPELVERGVSAIRRLFDQSVQQGKISGGDASSALQRVSTTTGWAGFERCDLVIEAIVENAAAKRALFTELAAVVRPDAILASNTSALPIEEIAGHVPDPSRTIGIHFFNPVGRMALVELILGAHTTAGTAERALGFVRALGKSPVICRSSPGFLVTRVLFFYLNAAVRRWEEGMPTAEIDGAMREFGWPMGPMRLIDEVGVDVTDFIFGEMEHYFPDRFRRSRATTRLLAAGLRGRKDGTGRGFYRYDDGRERANDEITATEFPAERTAPAMSPRDIVDELMHVMTTEAERCLEEGVVKSPDDIDFALLSGAGFPAFRGGLARLGRAGFGF